nr:homeobox protein notochord [Oryctolagus cuniculus]
MPSPGSRRRRSPAPSGRSPAPQSPKSPLGPEGPGTSRTPGHLESSFSVEAILARPEPRTPAASLPPASACATWGHWTEPSRCPARVLPWACPATGLPAYLSVGLLPLCPWPPVPGLHMAPFCGLQGFGVAGLEVAHCAGLWGPPYWPPTGDLHDAERHQKRVRTMFNLEQLEELERVFAKQHNLVGKKRAQLAARLNLTENQVRVWFQNRRVKYQKQQKLKATSASLDEPSSSSDSSIQSEDTRSGEDS